MLIYTRAKGRSGLTPKNKVYKLQHNISNHTTFLIFSSSLDKQNVGVSDTECWEVSIPKQFMFQCRFQGGSLQ